jgi:hypothetical protein
LVLEVLHVGVGTGKEETLVPIVPPNNKGWPIVGTSNLEDLAISLRFADVVALDYDPISNVGLHRTFPPMYGPFSINLAALDSPRAVRTFFAEPLDSMDWIHRYTAPGGYPLVPGQTAGGVLSGGLLGVHRPR